MNESQFETLSMWLERNKDVYSAPALGFEGAKIVYSRDPELWHLIDWRVSSTASGPSVIMRPRPVFND